MFIYYLTGTVACTLALLVLYFVTSRRPICLSTRLFCFLAAFSAYMPIFQWLKHNSLHMYVDFSHWQQLIYSISITGKPYCMAQEYIVPGTLNYLSAHFVPLVYLFGAAVHVFPRPETILVLNYLIMASSVVPLCKLANFHVRDHKFSLFVVALLLWYPTFQYIVLYEFEMLRFSIPVLLWMLYFWVTQRRGLFFLFVFLAILIREEVGLTIMMFGLYATIFEKKRYDGLITACLGFLGFMVITKLVMPSLRVDSGYEHVAVASFNTFGTSPGQVIANILRHPATALQTIFRTVKLANIFMLFLPLGFVPLLAPSVLICILANLGVCLLSASNLHVSYMLYYVSPSVPFIFYAFIKAWPRLLLIVDAVNRKFGSNVRTNKPTAVLCVCGIMFVANIFFGPSPISLQFWFKNLRPAPFETQNFHYSAYKVTEHHRKVGEFCKMIPDSAVVSTQHFLFPPLFRKKGILIFPRLESLDGKHKADFVFFDKTNSGLKKESTAYRTQRDFDVIEKDKDHWRLVNQANGYYLYQRIGDKDLR